MNLTYDFLNYIRWNKTIQFTDCHTVFWSYKETIGIWKNIYFVWWLENKSGKWKNERAMDSDITEKSYMVVDIDIRKDYQDSFWVILTDDELLDQIVIILWILDSDKLLSEYSYVINSWNWLHIYYIWTPRFIDPYIYKTGVSEIYDNVNRSIETTWFKCDPAAKNISRLTRVPDSINYWRQKYWLEPAPCYILSSEIKMSSMYDSIESYADARISKENTIVRWVFWSNSTYDAIDQINVAEIFCKNSWIKIAKDWKNFISPKDWWYIWLYYLKDKNILVNSWTSHLSSDLNAYWPFTYVKYEVIKTNDSKEVYDWFKENYPNIKEIDDIDKNNYKIEIKNKKEQESKENWIRTLIRDSSMWDDVFMKRKNSILFTRWFEGADKKFWKIQSHDLVVLVGSPASWKTAFTYFMTRCNAALWTKVRYFTLELNPSTLKMRTACNIASISKIEYQEWLYSEDQWRVASKYYDQLDSDPNIDLVWYWRTPNIDEICSAIEDWYNNWYLLFFLDNLWKISWTSNSQSENDVQIEITSKLQSLKNKYPIAIVLLHHLRKKTKMDTQWMSSEKIRWSQKIADNATIVIWIERDEWYSVLSLMKDTMWWITDDIAMSFDRWNFKEYNKPW